jgi:putative DNA primase/helicase
MEEHSELHKKLVNESLERNYPNNIKAQNAFRAAEGIEMKEVPKEEKRFVKAIGMFFDKRHLAEQFLKVQPLYYDSARNWWVWCHDETRWNRVDETHILNLINKHSMADTINSKHRNEILEALKQEGRKNRPQDIPKNCIQFKNILYNIQTGDRFLATPNFFVTNPLPFDLHEENFEQTPTIDKIFEEWVGKEHIRTLYEILAYCMIPQYPINRLFCFIGAGMNGKSKFLELLRKFIGEYNCTSTELDLLLGSRFEVTRLHKKLVCQMGETNFNELTNTSILKKLTGGDMIGFEYKRADLFDDINYAKIIISTNNLPETTDKTVGFYRRWMIIDFPNQFTEKKDILKDIPEEEYKSLGLKCCIILKELLEKREFTNEGSVEHRTKRYEDKSNPFDKFFKEFVFDGDGEIPKWEFEKRLNEWCKANRFREISEVTINKKMKDKGIFEGRSWREWYESDSLIKKQVRVWNNIKWK